jgi:hypothetical protein
VTLASTTCCWPWCKPSSGEQQQELTIQPVGCRAGQARWDCIYGWDCCRCNQPCWSNGACLPA